MSEFTSEYIDHLNSRKWKSTRRKLERERSHGRCEWWAGCREKATDVHHLHYDTLGAESLEDLQHLCHAHHDKADEIRKEEKEEQRRREAEQRRREEAERLAKALAKREEKQLKHANQLQEFNFRIAERVEHRRIVAFFAQEAKEQESKLREVAA
jgi:hypothetical protein